jgi:sugar/nucleoside kinase (ribokinase family)
MQSWAGMPSCCSPGARPAVRWQKKPLMLASVVCFGEILWDVLPTGPQPGGAPFNVAVHLHQLGQPVALISRVGTDEPGRELLAFIAAKGLATTYVQHDPSHPTGIVKADVDDASEVVYTIVQPAPARWYMAAWPPARPKPAPRFTGCSGTPAFGCST